MEINDTSRTILHVEDDPVLVDLVRVAFGKFGFRGGMISAGRVDEALKLLDMRARNREPLSLILVDMQLPDGLGLEVIHEVKADPYWQMIPVIVMSGESSAGMVDGAYALGANCYFPKFRSLQKPLDLLRTLFDCWLKDTILPESATDENLLQSALARSIGLRARTADFYMRLARTFDGEAEEAGFWLERALSESNLSNLLAFFQGRVSENDVSAETVDRITGMQFKIKAALQKVEKCLEGMPRTAPEDICPLVLDLMEMVDEVAVTEAFAALFMIGPDVATTLRSRATRQLQDLANHIICVTDNEDLHARARALLSRCSLFTGTGRNQQNPTRGDSP